MYARKSNSLSNKVFQFYSNILLCRSFQVIGKLDLGGEKCTGTALHHWNEVISSPRRQIAEWHKLRE